MVIDPCSGSSGSTGLGLRILFCDVEKWKIKNVENTLFFANDEMMK